MEVLLFIGNSLREVGQKDREAIPGYGNLTAVNIKGVNFWIVTPCSLLSNLT
jgi:hypothetical protein